MYVLLEIDPTSGTTTTNNYSNIQELQSYINNKIDKKDPTLLKNEIIARIESLFECLNQSCINSDKHIVKKSDTPILMVEEKEETEQIIDKNTDVPVIIIEEKEDIDTSIVPELGDNFGISDVINFISNNSLENPKKSMYFDSRNIFFQPAGEGKKYNISEEHLERLVPEPEMLNKSIDNYFTVYDILRNDNEYLVKSFKSTINVNLPKFVHDSTQIFAKHFIDNYCLKNSLAVYEINKNKFYSNSSFNYCLILLSKYTREIIDHDDTLRVLYLDVIEDDQRDRLINPYVLYSILKSNVSCPYLIIDHTKIFQQYFQLLSNLHTICKKYSVSSLCENLIDLIVFKLTAKMYNNSYTSCFDEVIPYLVDLYFESRISSEKDKSIKSSDLLVDFQTFLSELFTDTPDYHTFYKNLYNAKVFGKLLREKNIQSIRKSSGIFYNDIIYKPKPITHRKEVPQINLDAFNIHMFDSFEKIKYEHE